MCDFPGASTALFGLWRRRLREQPPAGPVFVRVFAWEGTTPEEFIGVQFDGGTVTEIPVIDSQAVSAIVSVSLENQPDRSFPEFAGRNLDTLLEQIDRSGNLGNGVGSV